MGRARALVSAAALVAVFTVMVAPVIAGATVEAPPIVPTTGTWLCCGSGGAAEQIFTINGNTGTDSSPGGGVFSTISVSRNGLNVAIITPYTDSSYSATFTGTMNPDGQSMGGTWKSKIGQSGTWTATRESGAPVSVSLAASTRDPRVGSSFSLIATVSAGNVSLTNVLLTAPPEVVGRGATVVSDPANFTTPLALSANATATYVFTLKSLAAVPTTAHVGVSALDAGTTVQAESNTLSLNSSGDASSVYETNVAPIASRLGTPGEIFHSMRHNLESAVITVAAILLITFPSTIFNQTFSAHYGEILLIVADRRRRLRRFLHLPDSDSSRDDSDVSRPPEDAVSQDDEPGRARLPWFSLVLVLGAVLGGLLSPAFGLNVHSISGFLATLVAFAFGAAVSWFISRGYRRRHDYPTTTYPRALPLGLCIAALCVLISRVSHFEPGYLYGIVVSVGFVRSLEDRHNAHLTTISILSTLTVAMGAWFLWVPFDHLTQLHANNALLVTTDDFLASVFIGGLVGTVVSLLPLESLPGRTLTKWRRDVWAGVFFLALFLLIEVELRPASGPTHPGGAPWVTVVVLFLFFGGSTFAMRTYFNRRSAPAPAPASPSQEPTAPDTADTESTT